jgi:hypothetical protein
MVRTPRNGLSSWPCEIHTAAAISDGTVPNPAIPGGLLLDPGAFGAIRKAISMPSLHASTA